jgi:citrate lyase subunit beta/citryl-CoA lyase
VKDWLPQDLEDAVAVSEKASARADVVVALQHEGRVAMASQCRGYVRVNAADTEWCFRDITAIAGPWLDGIILPKTESASILKSVDWALTALEAEHGMPRGAIDLIPIIETAAGMADLRSICRCGVARVRRLAFGAGDYTLDLAMQWGLEETELQHARSTLALESRAAGLERPIDSPFLKVNRAPKHRAQCRTNHSYNCRRR